MVVVCILPLEERQVGQVALRYFTSVVNRTPTMARRSEGVVLLDTMIHSLLVKHATSHAEKVESACGSDMCSTQFNQDRGTHKMNSCTFELGRAPVCFNKHISQAWDLFFVVLGYVCHGLLVHHCGGLAVGEDPPGVAHNRPLCSRLRIRPKS